MKFLITESQLDSTTQKVINDTLIEFKKVCDDYDNGEMPPDFLNWDDCDTLGLIERIKVVSIKKLEQIKGVIKQHPTVSVYINIYYSSIFKSKDFSDFLIALAYRIKQKYKIILNFTEKDLINTNKNRNL